MTQTSILSRAVQHGTHEPMRLETVLRCLKVRREQESEYLVLEMGSPCPQDLARLPSSHLPNPPQPSEAAEPPPSL